MIDILSNQTRGNFAREKLLISLCACSLEIGPGDDLVDMGIAFYSVFFFKLFFYWWEGLIDFLSNQIKSSFKFARETQAKLLKWSLNKIAPGDLVGMGISWERGILYRFFTSS